MSINCAGGEGQQPTGCSWPSLARNHSVHSSYCAAFWHCVLALRVGTFCTASNNCHCARRVIAITAGKQSVSQRACSIVSSSSCKAMSRLNSRMGICRVRRLVGTLSTLAAHMQA